MLDQFLVAILTRVPASIYRFGDGYVADASDYGMKAVLQAKTLEGIAQQIAQYCEIDLDTIKAELSIISKGVTK